MDSHREGAGAENKLVKRAHLPKQRAHKQNMRHILYALLAVGARAQRPGASLPLPCLLGKPVGASPKPSQRCAPHTLPHCT